jgi:hypothetical protein
MRTDRDDRADELARKIWELLEQRAAELRRLGVNEGYVRGLWHDTIARLSTELSARAQREHWDDEDQ